MRSRDTSPGSARLRRNPAGTTLAASPIVEWAQEGRTCEAPRVLWQWIAVGLIELLAVAYLVRRFVGPRTRPKLLQKPDVPAGSLVRKRPRS